MLGKRLFYLLNELDRGEKLRLHHQCENSADLRMKALKKLLELPYGDESYFEQSLQEVGFYFKHLPDSEKMLRRFIDFACKNIEQFYINIYLDENKNLKYYILARAFNERNSNYLFHHFEEKSEQLLQEKEHWFFQSELIDLRIKWLTRGQLKADFVKLKTLLQTKFRCDQLNYYDQMSAYYSAVSAIYLDDSQDEDFFRDLNLADQELALLIANSPLIQFNSANEATKFSKNNHFSCLS